MMEEADDAYASMSSAGFPPSGRPFVLRMLASASQRATTFPGFALPVLVVARDYPARDGSLVADAHAAADGLMVVTVDALSSLSCFYLATPDQRGHADPRPLGVWADSAVGI